MPIPSWDEAAPRLIDTATGRRPADRVIRDGKWVNVYSGEIIPNTDIAITEGRIAYVGPDASHAIGEGTEVIEANGRYLVPGLCDGHMHVESGMVTVTEFARAVMRHGTTSMFIDPHEIANVLGLDGVRLMHDEAENLPINVMIQVPPCVPAAPGLEIGGATIGVEEVREAMAWPKVCGLGEMMNFPGVATNDPKMLGEIAATQRAGKTVGGHYASPVLDTLFHGYVAGGPADDHEGTREIDAIERVRRGMRAMLRLGSAWYDVAAQITAVTEKGLDPRNFILCTDDCHSGTLINDGHMNRVVRHAIARGVKPVTAIQMATLNTAQHFGLERDIGSIAPGRRADIILTSDLAELPIELVIAGGEVVAKDGVLLHEPAVPTYPAFARNTVKVARPLVPGDFAVAAPDGASRARVRVIGVIENQAPTKALEADLPVTGGFVALEPGRDVCRVALIDRHRASGTVVNGFVSGFGYDVPCAVASTFAHDSHHLIVAGTSDQDMALAANHLVNIGGGITVFRDGQELATVALPIAGLMSDQRAEVVAEQAERMVAAMAACGCRLNNAYMQHSLLGLVVIPELRLSDLGLIDVTRFEKVSVFVD